jgi:nitrogen fixation NifU-like protein
MSDDALRETLLSYARSPRNGDLQDEYTHRGVLTNPGCGDRIEIRFLLGGDTIVGSSFHARGCALSTASAAILDDVIAGWSVERLRETAVDVIAVLSGETGTTTTAKERRLPAELSIFDSIRTNPSRRECVLLPWRAVLQALEGESP